jgi:hypothetical protein
LGSELEIKKQHTHMTTILVVKDAPQELLTNNAMSSQGPAANKPRRNRLVIIF